MDAGVEEVGPQAANDLLGAGAFLLDVREPDEWREGHAPGSINIPLPEVLSRTDALPRDRRIVVACRNGNRSELGTRLLSHRGFDAVNLAGGWNAWTKAGLTFVRWDGSPGLVVRER